MTLPYWDETDDLTKTTGLPEIFLAKTFPLDGVTINNPLYSYTFAAGVWDNLSPLGGWDYTKPIGYKTVRYPYSGLVGTPGNAASTKVHNDWVDSLGEATVNKLLNENVQNWLGFVIITSNGQLLYTGTREKHKKCLEAPNYTVFSNTTSATQWNEDNFGVKRWSEAGSPNPPPKPSFLSRVLTMISILQFGGFELPGQITYDNISGANGDMGENDTAGFDPILYFHHCFIDKMFWTWQLTHNAKDKLDIIESYPGTNSVDSQGPTPGVAGNTWLGMNSPFDPFRRPDGRPMTSNVGIKTSVPNTY